MKMNQSVLLGITLSIAFASFNIAKASGDDQSWTRLQNNLAPYGCNATQSSGFWSTKVLVTCDRDTVIAHIPELQQRGAMSPLITQIQLKSEPNRYASTILMIVIDGAIQALYLNPKVQESEWDSGLVVRDSHGKSERHTAFTFRFNRDLYNKINWPRFSPANLVKVAPQFKATPWAVGALTGQN
jgi:hypothetical protein